MQNTKIELHLDCVNADNASLLLVRSKAIRGTCYPGFAVSIKLISEIS